VEFGGKKWKTPKCGKMKKKYSCIEKGAEGVKKTENGP